MEIFRDNKVVESHLSSDCEFIITLLVNQVQLFNFPLFDHPFGKERVIHDESMRVSLISAIENKDYFIQVARLRHCRCAFLLLLARLISALCPLREHLASEDYLLVLHSSFDLLTVLERDLLAWAVKYFLPELSLIQLVLNQEVPWWDRMVKLKVAELAI